MRGSRRVAAIDAGIVRHEAEDADADASTASAAMNQ